MNNNVECQFLRGQGNQMPYIKKLISYDIGDHFAKGGACSCGTLEYDGYFYVDDDELPIRTNLCISAGTQCLLYKTVEIYMRDKFEDTSRRDDDGVCLFPTCRMKVYFRVISDTI